LQWNQEAFQVVTRTAGVYGTKVVEVGASMGGAEPSVRLCRAHGRALCR
jgi:hypothetical protein